MRPTGSFAIDSIVSTDRLPTRETGTTQERVATPSRWTVQAPHAAMPQPYFVPVIFNSSRNTHSNGVPGSVLTSFCCPFTVSLYVSIGGLVIHCCGQGMPASTHLRVAATNSSCVMGGGVRGLPSVRCPGFHAHNTSGSSSLCFSKAAPSRFPFLERSVITLPPADADRLLV